MPKVFVTKVYGFDAREWPIVAFHNLGDRANLVRESNSEDDVVAFIGTFGKDTAEEDKGRLLGMITFQKKLKDAKNILSEKVYNEERNFENGKFKWPHALPAKKAWHFLDPKPFAKDIINQNLDGNNSAVRTVELNEYEEDAERILALPKEEIAIDKNMFKDGDVESEIDILLKPTTGIAPTEYTATVERTFKGSGFTYALQYGKTSIWKIGISNDIDRRIKEINEHIPYHKLELDCDKWNLAFHQEWDNEKKAFAMEQAIFKMYESEQTKGERTHGERVRSSKEEIENIWMEVARKVKEI